MPWMRPTWRSMRRPASAVAGGVEIVVADHLGEAEDGGQRIADLVGEPGGEAADDGEPLGTNERVLGALERLEAPLEFITLGVEPREHAVELID